MKKEVLVVGAGPTGLVLALWLLRLGIGVRIIDKAPRPGTTSRAFAVHARTLEFHEQIGVARDTVAAGEKIQVLNIHFDHKPRAHIPFGDFGIGVSPFPYLLMLPQDVHERILTEHLERQGVRIEWNTELVDFDEAGDRVRVRIKQRDGESQIADFAFLCGCDGAHSQVRERIASFPGGTYEEIFYVADVEAKGPLANHEFHFCLSRRDFAGVFPLRGEGRLRIIGIVPREARRGPEITFDHVAQQVARIVDLTVERVNWFSTYHVHHRIADPFRRGRAFVVGDAAHLHSPAGGQGMNTGIGDAVNLAWKLAAVVADRAPESLLDSYEAERIGFARRLVATTDRAFSFATAEGQLADILRTRIAPVVIPTAFAFEAVRRFAFRTVSQIMLNYREGPLSVGVAGNVHGGDRLPWAPIDGADNFASLAAMDWQVHVYGAAGPALAAWCARQKVPLHLFAWRAEYERAGLARDALYLLRPDSYVALADTAGAPDALDRYFAERGIRPALKTASA
jgi:2-polyprenyl-6-methoxyphenol hydroxylase-like FAD-dependent oxidoreductase